VGRYLNGPGYAGPYPECAEILRKDDIYKKVSVNYIELYDINGKHIGCEKVK